MVNADDVPLAMPFVRIRSINSSEYPACMDWRGEVVMTRLDLLDSGVDSDGVEVVVATVEFLTVRLGEEIVGANLLDSISGEAEYFSELFADEWLRDAVADQFGAAAIDWALIILDIVVADPLHGYRLGAWALAEVIYRMLPSSGIVMMNPTWIEADNGTDADDSGYWRTVGLAPVLDTPVLGQASVEDLQRARRALEQVSHLKIAVALDDQDKLDSVTER